MSLMTLCTAFLTAGSPQTLRLNISGEPDSLDPRTSNNINADFILRMLFQGLTQVQEDGKVSYMLADKIVKSEDGKTYTFHLKKTKWSDGTELTADDFVYTWKSVLDPKTMSPCANLLYPIKNAEKAARKEISLDLVGLKAPDPYTFVVELEKPVPFFLDLIAATVFLPVPKHDVEKNGKWGMTQKIVANGPFKLTSWDHGHSITIEKNLHYWDANSVKIDRMDISMIENEMTALRLFEQGKLDWIGGDVSPLPLDAIPDLKKKHQMHFMAYGGTRYCALNLHTFPFNNLALRKAFGIATNRKALIDYIAFSQDEIATNVMASVFRNKKQSSLFPDGDKKLAQSYLQTALKELKMKPEDLKITLKYENSEICHQLAQVLQQQWQDTLGINVALEGTELKTLVGNLRKRDFQMGLIYWMVHYNSPMDIFDRYRSEELMKNYPGWGNKEYTQVLDLFFSEPSEAKRDELLTKAEKLFIDEMPAIPLFHFTSPYLANPALKSLQVTPIGDVYFTNAYLTKESEPTPK